MKKVPQDPEHPIDAYFRRGLEEHRTAPSPEFWARLEAEKSAPARMSWTRVAGFLLMIGLGGWLAQYGFYSDRPVLNVVQEAGIPAARPALSTTEAPTAKEPSSVPKALPVQPVLSSPDPRGWRAAPKRTGSKTAQTDPPTEGTSAPMERLALNALGLPPLTVPESPIRFKLILPNAEDVIAPLEIEEVEPYDEQLKTYAARSIVQLLRGEPIETAPKPQLPLEELRKPVRELFAMQRDLSKRFNQPRPRADQPQTTPEP
ncbi:hypothetical protein GC167_01205 [bacterium]|nr:hypothetical protein [bacterium]